MHPLSNKSQTSTASTAGTRDAMWRLTVHLSPGITPISALPLSQVPKEEDESLPRPPIIGRPHKTRIAAHYHLLNDCPSRRRCLTTRPQTKPGTFPSIVTPAPFLFSSSRKEKASVCPTSGPMVPSAARRLSIGPPLLTRCYCQNRKLVRQSVNPGRTRGHTLNQLLSSWAPLRIGTALPRTSKDCPILRHGKGDRQAENNSPGSQALAEMGLFFQLLDAAMSPKIAASPPPVSQVVPPVPPSLRLAPIAGLAYCVHLLEM